MEENRGSVEKHGKDVITNRGELYVPEDIVRDILLRLPGRSLVRFKSVCKNWRNMISDPGFEDINFQQLISKMLIVCRIKGDEPTDSLLFELEESGTRARKVTSLCIQGKVCAYNSLLLFGAKPYSSTIHTLCLYDRNTHQQKQLPEIPESDYTTIVNALVFDATRQKYKVMVFYFDDRGILTTCYFYALNLQNWKKEEKWKKSKPPPSQRMMSDYVCTISLNGIFYCLGAPPDAFIQPMNIATEEFLEIIRVPFQPIHAPFRLLKIKGSLCLTNAASPYELDIWVLKDSIQNVWINQYKISFSSIVNRPSTLQNVEYHLFPALVAESCNSRITYILVYHHRNLYWYNMDTQEMKFIDVESDCDYNVQTVSCVG